MISQAQRSNLCLSRLIRVNMKENAGNNKMIMVEKITGIWGNCMIFLFTAPELFNGEYYGSGCDIWSLGVIMYRLLCMEFPF